MSSPRVGNPRVGVSASCPVTRLRLRLRRLRLVRAKRTLLIGLLLGGLLCEVVGCEFLRRLSNCVFVYKMHALEENEYVMLYYANKCK